ncbi:unnamed protein product, partial [Musa banksii]
LRINIIVRNKATFMARIPEDIFYLEILPKLPYDSLFRFKFVCKSWLHFITQDPSFARQHLSYNGSPGFMQALPFGMDDEERWRMGQQVCGIQK